MNSFKSVLFVAPNYKFRKGGISSVLRTYSKELRYFNFFPSVFFQKNIINTVFFPLNIIGFVLKLLFEKKIKIVHIHGASRGSFIRKYIFFYIAKSVFNKKVFYHIHGAEYHIFYSNTNNIIKDRIKYMINNCDSIIVLSKEWHDYFYKEFEAKSIFILNNIVEYVEEARCKKIEDVIQILFLGRIGERKGVFDLLESIVEHKEYFKDKICLKIGGDGDVEKLKEFINCNKLEKFVQFLGWVDSEKKKELLINSDLLILPSYNEGLPISILEAMSYSLPIIATEVGGIPQVVRNNINGKLIIPGDKEQIFTAIKYYFDNQEKVVEHGKKSYEIVKQYFPESVLNKLNEIYSINI